MSANTVRSILAISIIGVFMFITAFLVIFPLVTSKVIQLAEYADFFVKASGVYTGIIGVIVGYYFGRALDAKKKEDK